MPQHSSSLINTLGPYQSVIVLVKTGSGDFAMALPLLSLSRREIWSKNVQHLEHLSWPREIPYKLVSLVERVLSNRSLNSVFIL